MILNFVLYIRAIKWKKMFTVRDVSSDFPMPFIYLSFSFIFGFLLFMFAILTASNSESSNEEIMFDIESINAL